ncbi:dipeptide/oligopeptide/nickel ABC transporter permease/ATP-binding protein [Streptacidiphilus sp. P02-A3a]|uniref:dipeptide/oligopeptide/nickel ABC transporter permease/ATP-binding protein n=1 Tax=Streptacidiphilus sp. P02-A3a TaxID=2704468 RepID=UPI0015FDA63E|nr:dipeptide/oligopeptide/nickel ABC transporter permease/ATP-binding protein [Streptacidiphilus sp. P02-A3a]QMU71228.1 dipeptide/oligopeptide/nickel ABC transporter permease/ATP-binding protein [Streptacidiphilus sp. P02-A3a]
MRTRFLRGLERPGVRFRALPRSSRIALGVLLLVVLAAAVGPLFSQNPLTTGIPMRAPGSAHWFGTDRLGRDVFARVLDGARYSLVIGLGATAVALLAGCVLGALAATSRTWVDETVMRILDVVMAFPPIALAAVLVTVFGNSVFVLVCTIAFVYVPMLTRVVRANVQAQYGEDYVAAERVIGARRGYIVVKHVAVNCAAPVAVFATVLVANAIVFEASLSFIGAGVQDPAPSWGNVLSYGQQILLAGGWWATLFPGLAILLTVLALNIVAEGMTDASALAGRGGAAGKSATAADPVALLEVERDRDDQADVDASLLKLAERINAQQVLIKPVRADAPVLLAVENLSIRFPDRYGETAVVDGISFTVREGETLGLVGESGCGKSITSLAVMGLLARNAEVSGSIGYRGRDLLTMSAKERLALAGPEIAMVYQDALSSLNPSMLVGKQLAQLTRRGGSKSPAELLELVGLSAERTLRSYPHELSGGQRQRVLIAMALSRDPRLLIADEPTTALDVTVQAQVVDLLVRLRDELGFAMVLVSHDLALVGDLSHRVAVMYAGQLAEVGDTRAVLTDPAHHYSRGLLGSVVSLEAGAKRLHQIHGVVPAPQGFGAGCRFASRCERATPLCRSTPPVLADRSEGHALACHHPATSATLEGSLR